ncbi:MAG: methyltransferase domain-containing protein [Verrucomicrobiae bacterium]|nr:methyltransferase domain-containing protein [Verrucomicrobiae bacterium]
MPLCAACSPTSETSASPQDDANKMPGHWLLAKLGKRVLRPGGLQLTRFMLEHLDIQTRDDVVEFAPGLGVTARLTLEKRPSSYTAVERDETAAATVRRHLSGARQRCHLGTAEQTGLPDQSATVVYGEAMLTMQGAEQKRRIVGEAFRLLKPGGRYGIHEMSFTPDDLPKVVQEDISREMSRNIHVGARPLSASEWRDLLQSVGFRIASETSAPMDLLEPGRLFRDEGFLGALRFVAKVLRSPEARSRVLSMRRIFRKHRRHLAAISLVAVKP